MSERYWIAPSVGKWNDPANWSATSGGTGGASVPGPGDTAYLDLRSSLCLVTESVTVEKIIANGTSGDLMTLAPLICTKLEWAGQRLMLANSQIGLLSVQRTNSTGSTLLWDEWCGASLNRLNPMKLTWTKKAGTLMTLQWSPFPGATAYEGQYSANGGVSWINSSFGSINLANPSFSGIFSNPNTLFRVRAVISGGYSEWTVVSVINTVPDFTIDFSTFWNSISTVPSGLQPLKIGTLEVAAGANAITIENRAETRLTGNVTIPTGINVTKSSGGDYVLWGTQDQEIIDPGELLDFSIEKTAGKVTLNGVVIWQQTTLPATPLQIFFSDLRMTEIDLWWNAINGATSYILERTINYGNSSSWVQVYNGSATSRTDSGLTPGIQYYYRLKAVNSSGESSWSPMVALSTIPYPVPEKLTISKVTADSITLQWTSQYNPIDLLVAWSPNGVDSWTEIQTLSSSFVFSGLTPETTYYFRVRARYTGVNSPWSQVVSAMTLPLPKPTNTSDTWSVTKRIALKFEVKTGFLGEKL